MAGIPGLDPGSAAGSALDRQTDALLRRYAGHAPVAAPAGTQAEKGAAAGDTAGKNTFIGLTGRGSAAPSGAGTRPGSLAGASAEGSGAEKDKIEKSARDFESILLGTWLQQAEQSFATVPGGDGEDEDADPGKDQLQGMSVQSLASALTAAGGIGLASMIARQLSRAEQASPGKSETGKAETGEAESGKAGPVSAATAEAHAGPPRAMDHKAVFRPEPRAGQAQEGFPGPPIERIGVVGR